MIPYGRQNITEADIAAVVDVLKSDFLTQGPKVPAFEAALAKRAGARHAVVVNSATSALHIACEALGLGRGDILWTSPITFVASANCARYCGADVDFVDIDAETFNLSPRKLEEKLQQASKLGKLPKIIVAVHMCGQSCDMAAIGALARTYGVKVIEDASHAVGGLNDGAPVGNCAWSDITVFSFHPVKIITTAEGGAALTNNAELARRMERLRSHGITRDPSEMTGPPDGGWYYQQVELGWNYRMTELQAALGLSQLDLLERSVSKRHQIAQRYDMLLANAAVALPGRAPHAHSALHLYVIRVQDGTIRKSVYDAMRSAGIGVNVHYIPVHLQPYYRALGFKAGDFPVAEDYYARAISLPMFPELTEVEQDHVVATLKQAVQ